ncbi:MraY family glycosyltransferase [Moorena sp. SIO2C4]|uniref:glycosyltransferase family 4 protein n=1 Tax=Moorena sp. SIO2C4 TaxID=2607824 RepID=UPI0013CD3FE4|nr:MraY family glycosyltransferase [Moorena sp. SIO2C4]NES45028.1 undecaprenyl/decaprenyl-phosphate alpha-N-acetylglucosaminyl 1-phosphate transferase [Moorena sp. SIO2C4]
MVSFGYYVVAFIIAALIVFKTIPLVKAAAIKYQYTDLPAERKVHRQPMVRLGGISICASTLIALFLVWSLGGLADFPPEVTLEVWAVFLGSFCFFLIGVTDDLVNLSPLTRLLLQAAVASLVWKMGVRISFVSLPGVGIAHLEWLSLPITVLWLTGVVNGINWIDGLDGLASGVAGIAGVMILLLSLFMGETEAALISAALVGSLLGFLYYNFNPAQIFMGDGGSYFIGFTIASLSVIGLVKSAVATTVLLPFLVLAVPLLDMSAVITLRLCHGSSPFQADQRHLHHRLLKAGLSHRLTVLLIYALTLWAGSLALVSVQFPRSPVIVGSTTILLGLVIWRAWQSVHGSSMEQGVGSRE